MRSLQLTQEYGRDISLDYIREREQYVSEVLSRNGLYRIESPDLPSLEVATEELLQKEYNMMMLEVNSDYGLTFDNRAVSPTNIEISSQDSRTLVYATPDMTIYYDEMKGEYVADFLYKGEITQVYGEDRSSVMYQADGMLEDARLEAKREAKKKAGDSGSGSSSHSEKPEKVEGHKVKTIQARQVRSHKKLGLLAAFDLMTGGMAISQGRWLDALFSGLTLAAGEWFSDVESIWDKKPKKKLFAASFGGILIVAGSKRELKKMLVRQRNKRIQRIMAHVRSHNFERENASTVENITKNRLKSKKTKALALKPRKWEIRIGRKKRSINPIDRAKDMRTRVRDKRKRARGLWASRIAATLVMIISSNPFL